MEDLIIEPGIGIGTIKLGMTKPDVEACLAEYSNNYKNDLLMDNFFVNRFNIEYNQKNEVEFIEVDSSLKELFNCKCNGVDVFRSKADDVISAFSLKSAFDPNTESETLFRFPSLGISFWRSRALKEKQMEEAWFKEMDPEIQEDEKRFLYFEAVSVSKTK